MNPSCYVNSGNEQRRNALPQLFIGLLIGVAMVVGIYAFAWSAAKSMARNFSTVESSRHTSIVKFETAIRLASNEQGAARIKCESHTGTKKDICNFRAEASELHAKSVARINYAGVVSNRSSALY